MNFLVRCAGGSLALLLLLTGTGSAHQPHLVSGERVRVREPEISKAYYGELSGRPAVYELTALDSFDLYLNILAPDVPDARTDFSVEAVIVGGDSTRVVARLDGPAYRWGVFHEPVGNDNYRQGPELRLRAEPGSYRFTVSNPGDQGKYVLAIGERESFPLAEIARTVRTMPGVKRFFGKPGSSWFRQRLAPALGIGLAAVAAATVTILLLSRRH